MYKIIIRNQEPVFIENGKEIMQLWQDNKLPARMVIKNIAFICSDIRSITNLENEPKVGTVVSDQTQQREYNNFRVEMLRLPIEERAKRLYIAKCLWSAYRLHSKEEMTPEIEEQIIARQLQFFKENPRNIYANPTCYKDLIVTTLVDRKEDKMNHITVSLPSLMMKHIAEAIRTDMIYAR